ncbi:MAG: Ig-like domain-containing protein [Gemmatimonadales bacterium]
MQPRCPRPRDLLVLMLVLGVTTCGEETGPNQPLGTSEPPVRFVSPTGLVTADPPEILVGAGDIAECDGDADEATAQLLDNIPGAVFTLGDNVYPSGSTSDYNNCYDPTWGRHKSRTFPSAGNKEYDASSSASPYFNYFGSVAGTPGQGYYSFDLGQWHIIVLNSNIARTPGSPQVQWLRADLAAHPNLCTLAYWHHPLYSSTTGTGSGGVTYSSVRLFWDTLYAAGVDLVLGGHRHLYDRLAPMRPNGTADPTFGIRQIVVGTGGEGGANVTNLFPTSEVREGRTFGVLKLYLYPDSYAWKFVPVAGKTFTDSSSTACHSSPGGGGPPVSPSLSTVSAAPTALTAGSGASTITVTARDGGGNPVSGAAVALSATGGGNTLTQPSGPTDASGIATGTLSSTGAGTKTVSATISGISITQTATIGVSAGPPSASQSTVSANPAVIAAGSGTSTITVTVRDQHGNPVNGSTVSLSATGTGNTLTQPAAPTNASGVATGTLASTDAEQKTVSATADATPITQTAAVTVVPPGGAEIAHALLTFGNNTVNQKIYTTAAIAPAPNTLVTVAVVGHRSSGITGSPTLSGGGMSAWTEVASVTFDPLSLPLKRMTIYRATSASPGSGPITITFPNIVSNSQWIVSQWSGVDLSGVNGAGAIVQAASNRADQVSGLTAALAAFGDANNVAYGVVGLNATGLAVTPGTGFTEIAEQSSGESPRSVLEAEWATNDNTIDATWTGLLNAAVLGIELRAGGAP